MTAAIELKNITVKYGANVVLRDLSLAVKSGEFVALLGASGCGKTTALKVIAGLLAAETGEVWLGGRNISTVAAEQRDAAMVFQKPLLFPFLNVAENVAFGLKMRHLPKAEIARKVADALALVQLSEFGHRSAKQLSGGQEQRVALARALVTNPRVLLLDEPFSALDAPLRVEMRNLIRSLQQRLQITAIFVTHDQEEAVSIADRIAFLDGGQLAQMSEPKDFFLTPQTKSVAHFFGWKILSGRVNGSFIDTPAGAIAREKLAVPAIFGDRLSLTFDPRRASLAVAADGSDAAQDQIHLHVRLERVINLGAKAIVQARFANGEPLELETANALPFTHTDAGLLSIPVNAFVLFEN